MYCLICATQFYAQTSSSPAEPCDCGGQVSMRHVRESLDRYAEWHRVMALRETWVANGNAWPEREPDTAEDAANDRADCLHDDQHGAGQWPEGQ